MLYRLGNEEPQLQSDVFVADNATVIGRVELLAGSSVWFNTVIRGDCDDIKVGENSNIQDMSVLHTDTGVKLTVGRDVTVGHKVMLHGCTICDNSLVGINAVVLNGAKIGKNSILGANSLLAEGKEIPEGVLAMGSPAKVVRDLKPQEIQFITLTAQHYVANARKFINELQPLG